MAPQEQVRSITSIEARVYRTRQDPRCRLCKDTPETVQQITPGCQMQHTWNATTKWLNGGQEHLRPV